MTLSFFSFFFFLIGHPMTPFFAKKKKKKITDGPGFDVLVGEPVYFSYVSALLRVTSHKKPTFNLASVHVLGT